MSVLSRIRIFTGVFRKGARGLFTPDDSEHLQREPAREILTTTPQAERAPPAAAAPTPAERLERRERAPISPLARKLAEEHKIDVATIRGTGPGGRIVKEDIERAKRILDLFKADGPAAKRAIAVDGKMVDQATLRLAKQLWEQAVCLGLV